ncbi:uncharacterized protein LOC117642302 isoform X2 [Thrips palmi]|uniref:Uncharacterized protein LOC117642302 isoform X2 n=1 Tax=Thrips palmi TaxID=161013 RepID=A0A6P8YI15_THRPL|nr:uncharacterized protein LOC117642302 isoform X2 [Thrips palmi]
MDHGPEGSSHHMECQVCLEQFDAASHRPKVLPCGHTFCLKCIHNLRNRKCPLDSKVFESSPDDLVDNWSLVDARSRPVVFATGAAAIRLWCLYCEKDATADCLEEHSVCSLKKARVEDAGPLLASLRQGEAVLDKMGETLGDFHRQLVREKAGLAAARGRLEDALEADAAVWEQAKQAAVQAGVSESTALLVSDLSQPAARCSLAVRRDAGAAVAWRGEVQTAEDATARMLLYRLARSGELQREQEAHEQQQPQPQRPAAPLWRERSNEGDWEMTPEETLKRMVVGARVAYRGRSSSWSGTVTKVDHGLCSFPRLTVSFTRDHYNTSHSFTLTSDECALRLLPSPLKPPIGALKGEYFLGVESISSSSHPKNMANLLTDGSLAQVRFLAGLPCKVTPFWSQKALQLVAPRLQGLQVLAPLQRHLDVMQAMPHLHSLSVIGATGEQLQVVSQMASLRRLEVHCPLDAPLPVLAFPGAQARLQWLRCGVHPLVSALALMRAHAATLEELQLVAASDEPYGCPDLAEELRRLRFQSLRRMVLLRQTGHNAPCRHTRDTCRVQVHQLWDMFAESDLNVTVVCSVCESTEFQKSEES